MATIERFEDLSVWKMAREYYQGIVRVMKHPQFAKNFELRGQIDASSGSVMDNIAEGFERNGRKEFVQFLSIAKGSCGESRSQLYRALDNAYISLEEFEQLRQQSEAISKSLSGFISYLRKSNISGTKYK
jgi:four helix bundle protein